MRISILGCGWLGLPLGKRLREEGHTVKGSTTTLAKLEMLKQEGIIPFFLTCDISVNGQRIEDFFQCDVLVITVPFRRDLPDPEMYQQQIRVIAGCAVSAAVPWLIFTSSTSVYPRQAGVVSEDSSFIPDNDRSRVLLEVEESLLRDGRFAATVVRYGGLCGGGRQVGRFLAGQKILTDGHEAVNLIHQEDAVEILAEIIRQGCRGEIFNACADHHPSRRELYIQAALNMGLPSPEFTPGQPILAKVVSNKKVKERLNYHFRYPDPLKFIDAV